MKNLIWILVLFAVAIGLALSAHTYSGNVYLVLENTMLRMNLHLFIIGLIAAVCALYVVLKLLAGIFGISGSLSRFGKNRKARQATQTLNAAGLAYFEGKYQQAGKAAQKVLSNKEAGDNRVLALMLAAHSAEQTGDVEARNQYLSDIAKLPEKQQLSRYLLLAEAALNESNLAVAEENLQQAAQINPRLTRLVRLQLRLAQQQNNALEILDKAEKLYRAGAINEPEWQQYARAAYQDLLNLASDLPSIKAALKRIPDALKNGDLCVPIANKYQELGLYAQAVAWVNQYYPSSQNAALLPAFIRSVSYLSEREQKKAIDTADSWLKANPKDARLLQYLGELAYEQQLWGKAKAYFEASLAIAPSIPARLGLAKVLEESNEPELAQAQRTQVLNEIADSEI